MPVLAIARYELFAQGIAAGETPSDAYRAAGFGHDDQTIESARSAASMLKAKPMIQDRVAEILQETLEERTAREENRKDLQAFEEAMDQATVLRNLQKVFELATERATIITKNGDLVEGDPVNLGAANRALELTGKQLGMFADTKIIKRETDGMTREQIKEQIAEIDRKLKAIGAEARTITVIEGTVD